MEKEKGVRKVDWNLGERFRGSKNVALFQALQIEKERFGEGQLQDNALTAINIFYEYF